MSRPFYVTTPIYYVNDRPHIGHAYTTIAADLLARYHRLAGRQAFFLTGTDEHGTKIAEAAREAGLSEQEFCDRTVQTFLHAWKALDINNDYFIRTTSERHKNAVRKLLDVLRTAKTPEGQDVVYTGFYEGLYCTGCERFYTEKELVDGLCPQHRKAPVLLKEKNYFFRLTAYLPAIKSRILSGQLHILPEERRNEVLGLIDQELPDFSLSRERVQWGIPLPFDSKQVAYVWVDALSNYISAIGYGDDPAAFDTWWKQADIVHLMGKEILKFHCLFWPALLMAAGLKVPETMFLHGWFTVDGEKMSKSLGNQIDPVEMVNEFGPDGARYLLLTQYPFGIDGDIQASRFVAQFNSDLANDLGNLASRVGKMIVTQFEGRLPQPHKDIPGLDALLQLAEAAPTTAYGHIVNFRITNAIAEAMGLVKAANKFFNDAAPWTLTALADRDKLGGILYACAEIIRIVSVLLYPVMPRKMAELRQAYGMGDQSLSLENAQTFFVLQPGTRVTIDQPIFPRLKPAEKTALSEKSAPPQGPTVSYEHFAKLELRVAEVLTAEKVAGADKLLKLTISLGSETRQIVAGVAQHYTPEQILGKRIIVVANLEPAKIRGLESRGMLLAAKSGETLCLVVPEAALPPGSKVS